MGKYDAVLEKLTKLPSQDQPYQEKVNQRKSEILADLSNAVLNAAKIADMYADARRVKDALEEEMSRVDLEIAALSELLVNQYEFEGVSSLKLDTGDSIRVQPEPYAVVEDRERFRQWCVANGFEQSLQLPWQTTNATVKAYLLDGRVPPDGVNAFVKDKIVFTKAKKAKSDAELDV